MSAQLEVSTKIILDTPHARNMLEKRYPPGEWAFMQEVAPATGGGTRYADAIAVNLWNSRGHAIHGFEIKVSRSDWLRELKKPEKAEPLYRYCDHWWVVAPKGIVKDGELPPTWGLLELRETSLVQIVAAPRLEATPITRVFFASLMRRAHDQIEQIADRKNRRAIIEAQSTMEREIQSQVDRRSREFQELRAQINKFKEETGIEFSRYSGPPIGLIKLAQNLHALQGYDPNGTLKKLTSLAEDLERAAKTVRDALNESGLITTAQEMPT